MVYGIVFTTFPAELVRLRFRERARSPSLHHKVQSATIGHGKIALETSMEPLKGIALDDDGPIPVTQLAEKWESHNHHGLKKAKMGVAKQ